MNVAFFGYRAWALEIKENLLRVKSPNWQFTDIEDAHVLLYYGWSEIIPKEVYSKHLCLILHPSPLPKYRGGSPLQHQIMAGQKASAVTILKVGEKLDGGDIYSQTPFSLEGTLDEIFKRIVEIGTADTIKVLDMIEEDIIEPDRQDEVQATMFKRRKPEQSELTFEDLKNKTSKELYNFIRSLASPYPNAYIVCKDGKKLYFTGARLESPQELKAIS